ncbi:hypothetical protein F5Y18DRAFT_411110 [Xylariaceae sp. FL1019]|nr:hypothetical protein F5Y18DRAFT_411110 [Xylariaceae sp. FL1019]
MRSRYLFRFRCFASLVGILSSSWAKPIAQMTFELHTLLLVNLADSIYRSSSLRRLSNKNPTSLSSTLHPGSGKHSAATISAL